ncbi:hypothetical protein, partial [Pantoea agglomerans]|uniref:hypothetical protein n=1 Tax=Enterobacter agglomerans TaxID=549 RepID=UPI001D0C6C8A
LHGIKSISGSCFRLFYSFICTAGCYFDHLVKNKGHAASVLLLCCLANDYSAEFSSLFAAYARYFPQKADKGEKIPPQGRQWPGRSLECAQFAKNRQFRRFLH